MVRQRRMLLRHNGVFRSHGALDGCGTGSEAGPRVPITGGRPEVPAGFLSVAEWIGPLDNGL